MDCSKWENLSTGFIDLEEAKILLTTSDYPPKLGGLSTFCRNIEDSLKALGLKYDLYVWNSWREITELSSRKLNQYDYIINIHSLFGLLAPRAQASKMINFIHGSEILFTSPVWYKRIAKRFLKQKAMKFFGKSLYNIFISSATMGKLEKLGYHVDYARDLVFHNCISLDGVVADISAGSLDDPCWRFICIARDVPHKNLEGCVSLCEWVAELTGKRIELILAGDVSYSSEKIKITKIQECSDERRDELYRNAHFNLLLSLDHSDCGFFEGFGLTPLEAARFKTPSIVLGTGGLPESVHDNITGWVMPELTKERTVSLMEGLGSEVYSQVSMECYKHVTSSHGLHHYQALLSSLMKVRE